MAIVKVIFPDVSPVAGLIANTYQAQNNQLMELVRWIGMVDPVSGSNIIQGAVINVGGIIYKVDADTAITGTVSKYVKITPSVDTLTCTASFVSNLTGVSWNKINNGYYDVSGNLYLFDELSAFINSIVPSINKLISSNKRESVQISSNRVYGYNLSHGFELLTLSGSWTVPNGVYFIKLSLSGGSGGSGGGRGGVSGADGGDGGDGGSTLFGSIIANGGKKGTGATSSTSGAGGAGGAGVSGITKTYGSNGQPGSFGANGTSGATGGNGGMSFTPLLSGPTGASSIGFGGNASNARSGGGGGGGGVTISLIAVVPGQVFSYTIGQGGAAGTAGNQGVAGATGSAGEIYIEY